MFKYRLLSLPIIAVGLASCGGGSNSGGGFSDGVTSADYRAEITRTEYGIPHIKADDWGSLGYGYGYAYAQDNFCVVMREVVLASGRSAELMGEEEGDIDADFLFRYLFGTDAEKEATLADLPVDQQDLVSGYSAGLNRYLADTGVENLAEGDAGCRNASWVQEIRPIDLASYLTRIGLGGSSDQGIVRQAFADVTGPSASGSGSSKASIDWDAVGDNIQRNTKSMRTPDKGSNAIALGGDATQSGAGLLLGNPHQPWQGSGRWYEAHLTIPGEYDVAGASLQGLPFIAIGFNKDIAWTHTVSFSTRFTLFDLKLNPDNPLQYEFDGAMRDITPVEIQAKITLADGSVENRSHTFYESHFGPVVNLASVDPLLGGWPMINGNVLAFRDANLDTAARSFEHWRGIGQATNLAELIDATKNIGNSNFHTLAADRNGDAFYGEISAIPHVTQQQLDSCINGLIGPLLANRTNNAITTLDGSTSACEWGEDADSPPGSNVYGFESRPKITTRDYVANSNNSYWLSDANNPLTGFPVVFGFLGHENQQQFMRTRLGLLMIEQRKNATDGLGDTPGFNLTNLQGLLYANDVHAATLVLDDVLTVCGAINAATATAAQTNALTACTVLQSWDRKVNLDSVGAQVFTEFWAYIRSERSADFTNVVGDQEFWAIDFNASDPVNTPSGIDLTVGANTDLVIEGLNAAVENLNAANVALDEPWQNVQFLERNGVPVPIHGGNGTMGIYSDIKVRLSAGGYKNPTGGNSYIQTVTWDDTDCPIADTILTHSQSTDPASPYYGDQTELYAMKQWVRMPYCEAEIEAAKVGDTIILTPQ
jgi:acyl-homoserine-lactone acylase